MSSPFRSPSQTFTPGAMTLPGEYFTSNEIFRQEQQNIFGRRWLCAGRLDQLAEPGAYFLLETGSESLIIVRGRDVGQAVSLSSLGELLARPTIRAFFNVCRHRGTRLCEVENGRFPETIQCTYHAWTYALDGRLVGAPFMQDDEGFDKNNYSLHQAELAFWNGFIFVNLMEQPEPFESAYAPVLRHFERFNVSNLVPGGRIEYDVQANWKLIFQNYSECLHCPTLHPDLSRLSPFQSGLNDLFEGPFLGGYMDIAQDGGSLTMSGRACGLPVGADLPAEDFQRVYYYSLFPNMLLSLHPDYVMAHRIFPLAPGRSKITCEWLFNPASFDQPSFNPQDAVAFWDMTNRQDWHVCELSQLGVASSRYQPSPYAPREVLLAAWDREYMRAIR